MLFGKQSISINASHLCNYKTSELSIVLVFSPISPNIAAIFSTFTYNHFQFSNIFLCQMLTNKSHNLLTKPSQDFFFFFYFSLSSVLRTYAVCCLKDPALNVPINILVQDKQNPIAALLSFNPWLLDIWILCSFLKQIINYEKLFWEDRWKKEPSKQTLAHSVSLVSLPIVL